MYEKKFILHIITDTDIGGAETSLFNLLSSADNDLFTHHVISLASLGSIAEKIQGLGIEVESLNLEGMHLDLRAFFRLVKMIHKANPSIVHCWMYHANLLGGLVAKMKRIPVIWAIHHHSIDKDLLKKSTILIIKISALLSSIIPAKVVFCSESALKAHIEIGFKKNYAIVIPNGFNTDYFKPDAAARYAFRKELSIPQDAVVIGNVARFDPTKDHKTLIRAASIVQSYTVNPYFIFCGKNVNQANLELRRWIQEADIKEHALLLGELSDLRGLYASMDIFVLSSVSEAFPNVIGEAMSCGVPCVVTDVGDSAYIVGETGLVVPSGDPDALAATIQKLLGDSVRIRKLGKAARERIVRFFGIETISKHYETLYRELMIGKEK